MPGISVSTTKPHASAATTTPAHTASAGRRPHVALYVSTPVRSSADAQILRPISTVIPPKRLTPISHAVPSG